MKNNLEMAQTLIISIEKDFADYVKEGTTLSPIEALGIAQTYAAIAQAEAMERQAMALEKIAKSLEETNSNIARMTLY